MRVFSFLMLFLAYVICESSEDDKFEKAVKRINIKVRSELLYMHTALHEHKQENVGSLKLDSQRRAMLDSLQKKLIQVKQVQFSTAGDDIETINRNKGIGNLLYQSDIVLTERQVKEIMRKNKRDRRKRQAFRDNKYPDTIWPNGIVHFSFSPNTTNKFRDYFRHGALEWQRETCLNFYEYIHDWIAAHEIGHALGMFHHHARCDRDEHIFIDESKIMDGMYDQFTKQTKETNDNYGLPYEYGSVMHYGSKSYSADKTRWHTMIPVDKMYIDGSQFVSFYDKLMMNTHYNCLDRCKSHSSAKCAMGGFPNPKDCLRCVCPGGYGGRLCNERPSGCGEVLQATTYYKKFEDIVGHSWVKKPDDNDFFAMCKYWIEAPLGRKVEVKFHNFTDRVAVQGCYYAGVEIKSQKDQRSTGYRFCSPSYKGEVFKSESNVVPIITWSRIWAVKTELWYRMV